MRAECERVIQLFPALADQLRFSSSQPNSGFSGAGVFRFGGEFGDFALRAWPRKGLPLERILGLHRLIQFVHWTGIKPISVPLANGDGTTITEFNGRYWQLEPWMPGTADFHQHPSATRLKSAMKTLAECHMAASQFKTDSRTERWFGSSAASFSPACQERHQQLAEWLEYRLDQVLSRLNTEPLDPFCGLTHRIVNDVKRIGPIILSELQKAAAYSVPLQPCLRDIWHDHVLFTGDEVTGMIDLSACRTENVATDLARLLGSLIGDETGQWQIAINEYSRHRPLRQSERKLIVTLDRSATVLSGLTWLRRRFLDQPAANYDWSSVLTRLKTIAARLHCLVSHSSRSSL